MLQLPDITLISISTVEVEQATAALIHSCKEIEYGAVKLVSHYRPANLPDTIQWEQVPEMGSIDTWNHYLFYHMWKHVDTAFGLLVHPDGFVVNPGLWRDEFTHYDYIGAPWDIPTAMAIQGGRDQPLSRVGNSVSLRSRKLMKLPSDICIPWRKYNNDYNEDTQITCHNRLLFEQYGCTFAPIELAVHFSREGLMPENEGVEPFMFHKYHYPSHPNWKYPRL